MREDQLVSPGILAQGFSLRRIAAMAISGVQISAQRTPGGKTQAAATLQAFFTACATALNGLVDSTTPTMAGATGVAASATQINLTFAESMDQTILPSITAFAVNNGGTVSALTWVSATVLRLTGTGYAAGDTVTYTKPAVNGIRDVAQNQVASGTKVVS